MFSSRFLDLRHNFSEAAIKKASENHFLYRTRRRKKYFLKSFVQSITNIVPGQEIQWQGARVTQRVGSWFASAIQMACFGQNDGFSQNIQNTQGIHSLARSGRKKSKFQKYLAIREGYAHRSGNRMTWCSVHRWTGTSDISSKISSVILRHFFNQNL